MSYVYTADRIRSMRLASISLMPTESNYVVTVQDGLNKLHQSSERVAYGMGLPLSKRAAGQLARAMQPLYKGGKPRAIMIKTAAKSGVLS